MTAQVVTGSQPAIPGVPGTAAIIYVLNPIGVMLQVQQIAPIVNGGNPNQLTGPLIQIGPVGQPGVVVVLSQQNVSDLSAHLTNFSSNGILT